MRRTYLLALAVACACFAWLLFGPHAPAPATKGTLGSIALSEEPFVPPSLEELSKVRWKARPCVNFMDHLKRHLESEPRLATEEEALALKNTSPEANAKILQALGRLPANDDEVDWDATMNRYIGADPSSLNPLYSSSRYEFWLEDLIYTAAFQFDWALQFYGDLNVIESWETSEDQLLDRVVLRKDLAWMDGKPLTAHDVEFTWKLLMAPKIQVPTRRDLARGLKAVKAYDDWTVVYFQKEALATNHLHVAWPILPRHVLEPILQQDPTLASSPFNRNPLTSGPYKLVTWRQAEELVLERRDEWCLNARGERVRPRPYFKRVRFRVLPLNPTRILALKTGEIDETELPSAQWTEDTVDDAFYSRHTKVRSEEWTYTFIGWNAKSIPPNPFFGDRRVRLAMGLALEHEFLLKDLFRGISRPGVGIFHPDSWMAAKELKPLRRDTGEAAKLLDEAGWKDSDGDGIRDKIVDGKLVPLEFPVSCPNAGTGPKVAELLHTNLKEIGVEGRVELIEWVAFQERLTEHKLQVFVMAMGTGVDPDTARNLWKTEAYATGRNYAGYSNPEVDALLEKGRREFDPGRRAEIYAQVDRLIYADHPITVLSYQPTLWAYSKSLRGYHPSPKGFYGYSPGFYSLWKKK
jgi:peptide/nickel transport system substrate-binding protein